MFYKVCFIFNYFWHFGFLVFYCLVIYCLVFYTQWSKEKVQKDKQRLTKHTYKTKDRVTRTPLKTGGELRCSGRISSSCSTSDTRRVSIWFLTTYDPVILLGNLWSSRLLSQVKVVTIGGGTAHSLRRTSVQHRFQWGSCCSFHNKNLSSTPFSAEFVLLNR